MRCAACHRPLKNPTVQHGHAAYGRRCAEKWGLLVGSKPEKVERDTKTMDMFEKKSGGEK